MTKCADIISGTVRQLMQLRTEALEKKLQHAIEDRLYQVGRILPGEVLLCEAIDFGYIQYSMPEIRDPNWKVLSVENVEHPDE